MSNEIREEYQRLFDTCVPDVNHLGEINQFVQRLLKGGAQYARVSAITKVPWYVIGLIHGMESGFDFNTHLHNGDPLTHRTVNEPKGRPPTGNPPFTWDTSAIDALHYDSFCSWGDWSITGILNKLEAYNGWGYRKHGINSPYLWSYSNQYTKGKYGSDGHFDPNLVSKQVGAAVALKSMFDRHMLGGNVPVPMSA